MMGLPDGEKNLMICLPILYERDRQTHTHTDRQTDEHCMMAKAALDASIVRQSEKTWHKLQV